MPMDDRTVPAKLRDAAIELVASGGAEAATVRAVAERAGVSPGLIRHYFGSSAGLIEACDKYVAEVIRDVKTEATNHPSGPMVFARLRDRRIPDLNGYLAHRLLEDTPTVNALVDQLIDDAEDYVGSEAPEGVVKPSKHPKQRTQLLTILALGSVVLHRHVKRLLDVDLAAHDLSQEPGIAIYLRTMLEIFSGLYTDDTLQALNQALDFYDEGQPS